MQEAAFGIVFNATRTKVLLVKRRDLPIWVLPGGGIDHGELPSVASIREVKEETGLDCKVQRHISIYTSTGSFTSNTYLYELEEDLSKNSSLEISDETVDVGYFDLKALPEPFFSVHLLWIQDALLEKKEPIVKPIEGISFMTVFLFALKNPKIFFRYLIGRLGLIK